MEVRGTYIYIFGYLVRYSKDFSVWNVFHEKFICMISSIWYTPVNLGFGGGMGLR